MIFFSKTYFRSRRIHLKRFQSDSGGLKIRNRVHKIMVQKKNQNIGPFGTIKKELLIISTMSWHCTQYYSRTTVSWGLRNSSKVISDISTMSYTLRRLRYNQQIYFIHIEKCFFKIIFRSEKIDIFYVFFLLKHTLGRGESI